MKFTVAQIDMLSELAADCARDGHAWRYYDNERRPTQRGRTFYGLVDRGWVALRGDDTWVVTDAGYAAMSTDATVWENVISMHANIANVAWERARRGERR